MGRIIDVSKIIKEEKVNLTKRITKLNKRGIKPRLAVILVGNDEASEIYVSRKESICEELGIEYLDIHLNEEISQEELVNKINELNNDNLIHGILLQLPLPKHLDSKEAICSINPNKDVDGLHPTNIGMLVSGNENILPCTAKGIITILDSIKTKYEGKNCVVIGRSVLVGKSVASLLTNRNSTVTLCHSRTKELDKYTKKADILIVATGKPNLITCEMIRRGTIVIDVGINRLDGKIVGDVDFQNCLDKVKYITKVPGGVGPMTIISLAKNVVELSEKNND